MSIEALASYPQPFEYKTGIHLWVIKPVFVYSITIVSTAAHQDTSQAEVIKNIPNGSMIACYLESYEEGEVKYINGV